VPAVPRGEVDEAMRARFADGIASYLRLSVAYRDGRFGSER